MSEGDSFPLGNLDIPRILLLFLSSVAAEHHALEPNTASFICVSCFEQTLFHVQEVVLSTAACQLLWMLFTSIAIHAIFLALTFMAGILFRVSSQNFRALVISGSEKNLSACLGIIAVLPLKEFGSVGQLTIPCIMAYVTQLFVGTYVAAKMAAAGDGCEAEDFTKSTVPIEVCTNNP
jgi:predicted Na+-dependent transporter